MTEKMILILLIVAVICEIINIITSFNEHTNVYKKGRDEGFVAGYKQCEKTMKASMELKYEQSQKKNSGIFKK